MDLVIHFERGFTVQAVTIRVGIGITVSAAVL
jgi:hypothetical protein